MNTALQGVRVLDLSRILAGPWASQLLGDYGADVVKIEHPRKGDDTRHWGPPWLSGDDGDAAYFLAANRNKRSLAVDLDKPDGQELVRQLVSKTDVLIENFRPGSLPRRGLDRESLCQQHPQLVYCLISAYGSDSSRDTEPGYDAMIQASAGLMSINGTPAKEGGEPLKVGVAIADIMTGMYAATAILAALQARSTSGEGQFIEVPLYDCQVAWLANQSMNYLVSGEVPKRLGNAHPNIVPYQSFATRDGYLMLAVGNDGQFRKCMDCLELPAARDDPRYATNPARVTNRESLVETLKNTFARQDTGYWLDRLRAAGVPAGPINDLAQVFASPYAQERGLLRSFARQQGPDIPTVANPVRFSRSPVQYRHAPPLLGEQTDEVLQEWLNYVPAEIEKLKLAGAIWQSQERRN